MNAPVPAPSSPPDPTEPPPPSWLRAAGLLFLVVVVAADLFDGRLDASVWALVTGLGLALYGPAAVVAITKRR